LIFYRLRTRASWTMTLVQVIALAYAQHDRPQQTIQLIRIDR
jgi:hypothetical protein